MTIPKDFILHITAQGVGEIKAEWQGELVRCQDCKWCDNAGKKRALICTNPYIDVDAHPDFFCGYAEKKN